MNWDPGQYGRFSGERERPCFDLLAAIPRFSPRTVVDLGCGGGNLTRVLAEVWPKASVLGLDSSPEMLVRAQDEVAPRLAFQRLDLRDWAPAEPVDLVFSNATLQWVEDHGRLIASLTAKVAPSGVLAVQMPGNHQAPSHREIAELATSPRWNDRLGDLGRKQSNVQPLGWYVEELLALGCEVNAWETTYAHLLAGENAVLEWIMGTHLRPFLARLDPKEEVRFLEEAGARLRAAYPARAGRTLFPFRRLFFVARRRA